MSLRHSNLGTLKAITCRRAFLLPIPTPAHKLDIYCIAPKSSTSSDRGSRTSWACRFANQELTKTLPQRSTNPTKQAMRNRIANSSKASIAKSKRWPLLLEATRCSLFSLHSHTNPVLQAPTTTEMPTTVIFNKLQRPAVVVPTTCPTTSPSRSQMVVVVVPTAAVMAEKSAGCMVEMRTT